MSYCQQLGKDEVIVVTKEDHQKPVSGKVAALSAALENDDEDEPGFILPNGELNWNCPCVGGMVAGPCGYEFRQAFSCFHKSQPPDRGAECADNFRVMHECMAKYPTVYGSFGGDTSRDDDDDFEEDEERHRQSADVSVVVDEKKDKK